MIGLYLEDSNIRGLAMEEFIFSLLEFNGYHYVVTIISGLILVTWKSEDLFDYYHGWGILEGFIT